MKALKKSIGRLYREVFVYKVERKHRADDYSHFDELSSLYPTGS